ncbi:MAG TPA: hypothetical protein PLD58_05460 [Phycisphaerae bacterium]|nr:hypothetical protein [Phycisphaerae bacterium]
MDRLADMIESALKTFGSRNIREMLQSAEWQEIEVRYNAVRTELLVNGFMELLQRVEQGHDRLQAKLAEVACQENPPRLTDVFLFWDMPFCATLRAMAAIRPAMAANSRIEASTTLPISAKTPLPAKRSWTQPELDEAIREYQAKRSARYQELVGIIDTPNLPEGKKMVARQAAQRIFGRNVIAEELGVKAAKMVSQSPAWIAIANALELRRKSGGEPTTVRSTPGKRIGLDIAVEKAAVVSAEPSSDYTSADAAIDRDERETTLREIRRLAESKRPRSMNDAKALLRDYQAGEMTDVQVRATVRTLMCELT